MLIDGDFPAKHHFFNFDGAPCLAPARSAQFGNASQKKSARTFFAQKKSDIKKRASLAHLPHSCFFLELVLFLDTSFHILYLVLCQAQIAS